MKKITIMAIAIMGLATASYAADKAEKRNTAEAAYNMNVNMRSLSRALNLSIDQVEPVADIHSIFTSEMLKAANADESVRQEMVDKAVAKDLKYMHQVLTRKQFRKYLQLLNATMINRGLR